MSLLRTMVWRYRRELVPLWTGLGLLGVTAVAHAYAADAWLLALPLGAGATAAWRWRVNQGSEKGFSLVAGSAATLWTTAAWWASPWHGSLIVFLCLGIIAGGTRWWWHRRRGDLPVAAPSRGAVRRANGRELRQLMQDWPSRAEAAELAGTRIHQAQADEHGYALTLALRPGQTVADVVGKIPRLESALEAKPGAVNVAPDESRADRCQVRVVHNDPLAKAIPWNGPSGRSIADPIHLGVFRGGGEVEVRLLGEHVLVAGASRRGQSGVVNVLVAELAARQDVVLWGVDCRGGIELGPWRRVLDRLVDCSEDGTETLRMANRVVDARARQVAGRGERRWRPSRAEPALLILVDELAELGSDAMPLFDRLARMGRALGVGLVGATQRPAAPALRNLDAYAQLTTRICLGMDKASYVDVILGHGRLGAGWRAERLVLPGSFLILAPGTHETPRPARAYWLSDDAVADVAVRFGEQRPVLDAASAAAVEPVRNGAGQASAEAAS